MKLLKYLPLLFFGFLHAQEEVVHSVYFEFDKYTLNEKEVNEVVDFIKKTDSTRIESIQIYGYTDDIGKDAYNFKLSTKRATAIQNKFIENGIKNRIIVTIEGKGRILIDDDVVENLPEKRSKNRRVDVVLNLKPLPKIIIPGFYNTIQKHHIIGDHIYLDNILFERGSSKLPFKSKRQLSINRAQAVYKYLLFKRIPKERMTFKGYGNTVPLGKGTEYDRRVELVITKT